MHLLLMIGGPTFEVQARDKPPAHIELREPAMSTAMPFAADTTLLSEVTAAVKTAGVTLRERYTSHARGVSLDEVVAEIHANDDAVLDVLREPLLRARRGSQWAEDELVSGALPPGEWWVVDPAEGNINHVHGMDEWAVTATLVSDNLPVLTVVHLPLTGDTYTAVAAWRCPPQRPAPEGVRQDRSGRRSHRHRPGQARRGRAHLPADR